MTGTVPTPTPTAIPPATASAPVTAPVTAPVSGAARDAPRAVVAGPVLPAGDQCIPAEPAGFKLAPQHHPAATAGAMCPQDPAAAVRFAAAHGRTVGVHATRHGGLSHRPGIVVTSTRRIRQFGVVPRTEPDVVEAGVKWVPVIAMAAEHGLARSTGRLCRRRRNVARW